MYSFIQRTILFAAAFSVPIQATDWTIGGFSVSLTKLVVALLLLLAGMQLLAPSHRRLPRDSSLGLLAVFAVSVLISSFVTLVHGQSIWFVLAASSRFFGLALFYVVLLLTLRERKDLVAVLWGLGLGAALAGLPALTRAGTGTLFDSYDRFGGLAGQPNTLAYELSIAIAVVAALYFSARSFFTKLVLMGTGGVILLAIIGSLSRSAFASLVVMWALWLFRSRRFDTLRYALPGVAIAAILYVFLPTPVQERMATVVDPAQRKYDSGTRGRLVQFEWATMALLSNPVTGVGIANFIPWMNSQPGGHVMDDTVHNSFFYVMATQGLLGLIPFLGLHLLAWRDYSRVLRITTARRKRGDPVLREFGNYALFLQIALLGSAVGGLAHQESTSKGLWIVFALSAITLHVARARAAELDGEPSTVPVENSCVHRPAGDVAVAT